MLSMMKKNSRIRYFLTTLLIAWLCAVGYAAAGNLVWCLHEDGGQDSHVIAESPAIADGAGRHDSSNHCGMHGAWAETVLHRIACVHIPLSLSCIPHGTAPSGDGTVLLPLPQQAPFAQSPITAPGGAGRKYFTTLSPLPAPALISLRTIRLLC
jgi:hypothetical protein